jgi:hypothetical protein
MLFYFSTGGLRMNCRQILAQSLAAILLMLVFGATAHAAPPQLLNRTISVAMFITVPATNPDGSVAKTGRQVSRTIYVSSQGRVFQKVAQRARGGASDKELGPDNGGALHFVGNKLVGMVKAISGASMMTISFDPSYQSCTVDTIIAGENGKPRVWKGLNGVTFTQTGKPQVSGVSCSIREGNAFAS